MKAKILSSNPETTIWERMIQLEGDLPPAAARALLKLRFSQQDHERMQLFAAKARAGTLTPREQEDLDAYERLGCLLDILHSKARRSLKKRKSIS